MNNDDRVFKFFFYTIANYRVLYIYIYIHTQRNLFWRLYKKKLMLISVLT